MFNGRSSQVRYLGGWGGGGDGDSPGGICRGGAAAVRRHEAAMPFAASLERCVDPDRGRRRHGRGARP